MRVLMAMVLVLGVAGSAHAEKWKGQKITIDVQSAEIANVLRLISDVSQMNIVFGDDVKGTVTIKLKSTPWDQALDVILKAKGYGARHDGNIIWVAPQSQLDAEEMRALDKAAQEVLKGPLTTRIVPVNYAKASELADTIKGLLTPRGSVTVDERTNTLIIRDVRTSPALRF